MQGVGDYHILKKAESVRKKFDELLELLGDAPVGSIELKAEEAYAYLKKVGQIDGITLANKVGVIESTYRYRLLQYLKKRHSDVIIKQANRWANGHKKNFLLSIVDDEKGQHLEKFSDFVSALKDEMKNKGIKHLYWDAVWSYAVDFGIDVQAKDAFFEFLKKEGQEFNVFFRDDRQNLSRIDPKLKEPDPKKTFKIFYSGVE